jgi:hypothetical protein
MQRMSDPPIASPRAHDKVRAYMRLASPALTTAELLDVADMIHDIIRRRRSRRDQQFAVAGIATLLPTGSNRPG